MIPFRVLRVPQSHHAFPLCFWLRYVLSVYQGDERLSTYFYIDAALSFFWYTQGCALPSTGWGRPEPLAQPVLTWDAPRIRIWNKNPLQEQGI